PVAPHYGERSGFAERPPHVSIRAAFNSSGELREHPGEAKTPADGDEPAEDRVDTERRKRSGKKKYSRADDVAYDERQSHPKAELRGFPLVRHAPLKFREPG